QEPPFFFLSSDDFFVSKGRSLGFILAPSRIVGPPPGCVVPLESSAGEPLPTSFVTFKLPAGGFFGKPPGVEVDSAGRVGATLRAVVRGFDNAPGVVGADSDLRRSAASACWVAWADCAT